MVHACDLSTPRRLKQEGGKFHTQKKNYMNNSICCRIMVKVAGISVWKVVLRAAHSRCSIDTIYFLYLDTCFLVWASEPSTAHPHSQDPPPPVTTFFSGARRLILSRASFTANIPPPAGAARRGVTFDKLHLVWRHCSV